MKVFPRLLFIFSLALALAAQGQADAQVAPDYQAGADALYAGDYATALLRFRVSAERGYPEAQVMLGAMNKRGDCMAEPNYTEALKWYRLAASQGHGVAQGSLYQPG